MCDTLVATGKVTLEGVTIFGKNSDREPNEAQYLALFPAQDYSPGGRLRATYIEIPQAPHTYAVLLSKPFWMWGAEMGVNEHGVAIGNEAVFTKLPYRKEGALIGMDMLRLGLERGKNAYEALQVITSLLAEYGQGGNCGFTHPLHYHNSFIIADPQEAWVLETAGDQWAAKRVEGVYTISNGITLGNEWDLASPDLVNYAVDKGWCKGRDDFDFARCYSDFLYTRFSDCRNRCARTTQALSAHAGNISIETVMATLRDHKPGASPDWRPDDGLTGASVCMHASFGPVRGSQTVGSQVSHLHPDHPTHFFTASAAPCTSMYKPIWIDAGLPDLGPEPEGTYNPDSLFWRHEALHRAVLLDHSNRLSLYQAERDQLEKQCAAHALAIAGQPEKERLAFSAKCFSEAEAAEARWLEMVRQAPIRKGLGFLHRTAWDGFNRQAQMP